MALLAIACAELPSAIVLAPCATADAPCPRPSITLPPIAMPAAGSVSVILIWLVTLRLVKDVLPVIRLDTCDATLVTLPSAMPTRVSSEEMDEATLVLMPASRVSSETIEEMLDTTEVATVLTRVSVEVKRASMDETAETPEDATDVTRVSSEVMEL